MAVGDKYLVSTQGSLYGVTCVNVFNYNETQESSDDFPALAICEAFVEDLLPTWLLAVSSSFTVHCVTGEVISAGPATPQVIALTSSNVGDLTGQSLPANQVVCVSMYTGTFTKRGRGRHYFSGIPFDHELDNAISNDLAALYATFKEALTQPITEAGGGQWEPVVHSKAANAFPPIIGAEYSPQVRLNRSRTPRLC